MDDGTDKLIAKFIKYRKEYEHVGCGEIPREELLEHISNASELEPLLVEKRQGFYAMDFERLAGVLHDFYEGFLPGIFTRQRIYELVRLYMPEKLICDAEEVELDNQSYKFLYERLQDKYKNLEEEFHTQRIRLDGC